MSPLTLQWFPPSPRYHTPSSHHSITLHVSLSAQQQLQCPLCSLTSLPHPQGTVPNPLHFHNIPAQPHHSTSDCTLIPTHLSSTRLLKNSSQNPAPAMPGLFLVCQLPSDAQCAKHPARHHPRSPGRKRRGIKQNTAFSIITEHGKDLIITQRYKRNKEKKPQPQKQTPSSLSKSKTCWVYGLQRL